MLLTNGGTVAIESPFPYSKEARELIAELGIDPPAFQKKYTDRDASSGMGFAYFFDKETFEAERLVTGAPGGYGRGRTAGGKWAEFLARTPLSAQAQKDIVRIQEDKIDYMDGRSSGREKIAAFADELQRLSAQFDQSPPGGINFYQTRTHGLYGIGIDAVPALDCWAIHFPGFQGMGLDRVPSKGLSFTALRRGNTPRGISLPFSRRQRIHCAHPGAIAGSGFGSRKHCRGYRDCEDGLQSPGS